MPSSLVAGHQAAGLVDVLDRVLDKGLVIAGDIKVSLAEVELLTVRIRLMVCSIDKAEQIGLDWWKYDHHFSPGSQQLALENEELRRQVRALERRLASVSPPGTAGVPSGAPPAVVRRQAVRSRSRRP
jgi:gas vesicle protein GvpA/GvpJ/GvpM family